MPEQTLFFYDLETSGRDFRRHRIMQFAGQRTDMELNAIGEPFNICVKLSPEVIPEPAAVLITGITPQYAEANGISERDAIKQIMDEAFTPGTIVVGFNNVRFDDEYIRFTAYRNFHDAYEWCWKDGRSRWDMLDAVRLIRALRPEGVVWPVDEAGEPVNKLEMLAKANGLEPTRSHDALSDVVSLIGIARLLKEKQPRVFQYLLNSRNKEAVMQVADPLNPEPFIYASGRYGKAHGFTTVGYPVGYGLRKKVAVYNLLLDPTFYLAMSVEELMALRTTPWEERQVEGFIPFPAKELAANKCPAVAPYSTMREEDFARLDFDKQAIARNLDALLKSDLPAKLIEVLKTENPFPASDDPDGALYAGFVGDNDKRTQMRIRNADIGALADLNVTFDDSRLLELFLRYKARNAPETLSTDEKIAWNAYAQERRSADLVEMEASLAEIGEVDAVAQELLKAVKEWAGRPATI